MAPLLRALAVVLLAATTAAAQIPTPQDPERVAQALIERLQAAASPAEERAVSLEIMQNYYAKLRLKSPGFESAGARFYRTVKGENSLMSEVRAKVKAELAQNWNPTLVEQITGVENQASRLAQKAPMDLDEGILSQSTEENRKLRELIRRAGSKGAAPDVVAFTKAAQEAYEKALREVAGAYGVEISADGLKTVGLTFATPWHPEAYLASEVLKAGGVAPTSMMQQTAGVTLYKLDELQHRYGQLRAVGRGEEAVVEAARGMLKDLDKIERVFSQVELVGGATPQFSPRNAELIGLLKRLESDPSLARQMSSQAVEELFTGCRALAGTMESAVVLQGPAVLLKATMYRQLPEGLRQVAIEALASGLPVPDAARWIDDEIARTLGARLVTLREEPAGNFVSRLKAAWPDYKLKVGDAGIEGILARVETLTKGDLTTLVGDAAAARILLVRERLPAPARHRLLQRFLPQGVSEPVEKNTLKLIGKAKPAAGSASAFAFEAPLAVVLSMANGLSRTAEIAEKGLPAAEERRELLTAWVESLPVTGEILQGLGRVNAFVVSGDAGELGEAALTIAMGIAWVVPPLQLPTLVGAVLSGGASATWSAVQATRDRLLIGDWVDSGQWDLDAGTLTGLLDARGRVLPVPPDPRALDALFVQGDAPYHSPHLGAGRDTIRDSVVAYLDRAGFEKLPAVDVLTRAITNLFPDFDVMAALRMPAGAGMAGLTARAAREGGRAALPLFAQLERLHADAARDALVSLKADAELEFQTTHMVGAVRDAFAALKALGDRLRLPLVDRVREEELAVTRLLATAVTAPWEKHGIQARVVQRVDDALTTYREIERTLERVRVALKAEGVEPPSQFNLTGHRAVDAPRVADLAGAYLAAIARAKADAAALAGTANVRYDPAAACSVDIRQTLVRLAAVQVLARDWQRLAEQWQGNATAATASRDTEIAKAQAASARGEMLSTQAWRDLVARSEMAFEWMQAPLSSGGDFRELASAARERLAQAESDYEAARRDGAKRLADGCQTPATSSAGKAGPAATPAPDSPEAICDCLNEWYEKKWFPEMVAYLLKVTNPHKVVQASYAMVRRFSWDAPSGMCRGTYRIAKQYVASFDLDTAKRGQTFWNIDEAWPDSNPLSTARQRCTEIRKAKVLSVTACGWQ